MFWKGLQLVFIILITYITLFFCIVNFILGEHKKMRFKKLKNIKQIQNVNKNVSKSQNNPTLHYYYMWYLIDMIFKK